MPKSLNRVISKHENNKLTVKQLAAAPSRSLIKRRTATSNKFGRKVVVSQGLKVEYPPTLICRESSGTPRQRIDRHPRARRPRHLFLVDSPARSAADAADKRSRAEGGSVKRDRRECEGKEDRRGAARICEESERRRMRSAAVERSWGWGR